MKNVIVMSPETGESAFFPACKIVDFIIGVVEENDIEMTMPFGDFYPLSLAAVHFLRDVVIGIEPDHNLPSRVAQLWPKDSPSAWYDVPVCEMVRIYDYLVGYITFLAGVNEKKWRQIVEEHSK